MYNNTDVEVYPLQFLCMRWIPRPPHTNTDFLVANGMNGCLPNSKSCGGPQDSANFHYIGIVGNVSACEDTCTSDPKCSIFIWSKGSGHCWWRQTTQSPCLLGLGQWLEVAPLLGGERPWSMLGSSVPIN